MGSNCCRHKDQSPKVSLRKIFSRWTHRISPKSETVKIADAVDEGSRYHHKKRNSVATDPVFDSPENEDRNHVTMLLPDAPRAPAKKNNRTSNKRVSFQSDVEIMRTASSKSLDRFTVTVVQEEPKARSKSFDSYFDATCLSPIAEEYHKNRRTSSLEHLAVEGVPTPMSLISKLRRDTLGDALDFNAHKRPLLMPKPEEPLIEEESDESEVEDEELISSFKLASKLRRDTLGDALLLTKSRNKDDTPTGSSTEDLEETLKHSRLCSKLRRDTFGDALRQAVHCKACTSMEDITELEVPLPATPEEDLCEIEEQTGAQPEKNIPEVNIQPSLPEEKCSSNKALTFKSETTCSLCKTCASIEDKSKENDPCIVCSSSDNIPSLNSLKATNEPAQPPKRYSLDNVQSRKLTLTDEEISQTLEKIRSTGKIEPKEPYNLVYSSCMKGPFASSKENINKSDSKSSSNDSLEIKKINKSDILSTPDKNRNHIITDIN